MGAYLIAGLILTRQSNFKLSTKTHWIQPVGYIQRLAKQIKQLDFTLQPEEVLLLISQNALE